MAREMIEVVQRACVAWGSGDLAVLYELYTPDVVADGGRLWFETEGLVEGVDAVVKGFAELIGVFERNELIPEGAVAAGDTLIVPLFWRGLPAGGSGYVEQRLIGAFTFREGRIAKMSWFLTMDEALEALGLPLTAVQDMIVLEPPSGGGASG
jgi:ketosteroid isomerase-like protein